MPFQLACAQFAPQKGNLSANFERIAEFILQAASAGADHIVFPEACISGYFLEGGVNDLALSTESIETELGKRLSHLQKDVDVSLGFFESSSGDIYNSVGTFCCTANGAKLIHVYRKFFLATYGVFDDERFVSRGTELGIFKTKNACFGVLICEDVWHSILATLCALNGAQVILVASASPARGFAGEVPSNLDRYRRMVRSVCEEHGVYAANAMLCGFEGGKGFVGGSLIVDPFGSTLVEGPLEEEHMQMATVDLEQCNIARRQTPLLADLRATWPALSSIISHLKP